MGIVERKTLHTVEGVGAVVSAELVERPMTLGYSSSNFDQEL